MALEHGLFGKYVKVSLYFKKGLFLTWQECCPKLTKTQSLWPFNEISYVQSTTAKYYCIYILVFLFGLLLILKIDENPIFNNYSLKARWYYWGIFAEMKSKWISPDIITEPEANNCFSIYTQVFCVFWDWIYFNFAYFFISNFHTTSSHYFENFSFVIFTCRWM